MKKIMFFILPFLILLSGCSAVSTTETDIIKPANKEELIKIGFIGPLTGDGASIGSENLKGIKLAIDEINKKGGVSGAKIELVVEDDEWDGVKTVSAYKKLVSIDGIKYLFTPTYGGFVAVADQAALDGVIVINPLDASEELSLIGKNNFSIGIYDESIGFSIADYLNKREVKKAGAMIVHDSFAALVQGALAERFNGEFIIEKYDINETDYRSALTKLSEYDYLVIVGFDEAGRIVRQARELGIGAEIIGIDTFSSDVFRINTNGNYDGLKFAFWDGSEDNAIFHDLSIKYQDKYKKEPDNVLFLSTGYDAANILANAMRGCSGRLVCVRANLKNTRGHYGATGIVDIDEDQITRSVREVIHEYIGDNIVEVK